MGHARAGELSEILEAARSRVEIGARYSHYRMPDQSYEVLHIGFLEENEEPAVVYKALYGEGLVWVRKLSSFCEEVGYDGKNVPRFLKIS